MVLWTILPQEAVFPPEPEAEAVNAYEEITYQNTRLIVEPVSRDQCRIVRLLTTNPADYLKAELQPGTFLARNLLE